MPLVVQIGCLSVTLSVCLFINKLTTLYDFIWSSETVPHWDKLL